MRFKYYLRGIGLGIIFSVIVLTVSNNINKSEKDSTPVNNEEINTESSGKVSDAIDKNNKEDSQAIDKDKLDYGEEYSTQIYKPAESQKTTENLDNKDSESDSKQDTQMEESCEISVKRGETTWLSVGKQLKAVGFIDNAEDFSAYMWSKGYGKKIKTGKYTISKDLSLDEIGKMLTGSE